jgi:DNA (cytosine-5)-methyltransferase 1
VDNTEQLTILSLCTGYGGLELGLARALQNSLRVIAVEVEAYALANLVAKAEENKLVIEALWPDLRTFPAERFRGCFDFILAGYPCQPFSRAGKRKGAEDPRHLWPHISRIVQAVEPVWVFCENVGGHLGCGFPIVYRSLRLMGYQIEAGLFSAAECGATHQRERLYFLAHPQSISTRQRESQSEIQRESQSRTFREMCSAWPPGPQQVSQIPRATDGTRKELDRLRLLGNGVIPLQAEKAFRYLLRQTNDTITP